MHFGWSFLRCILDALLGALWGGGILGALWEVHFRGADFGSLWVPDFGVQIWGHFGRSLWGGVSCAVLASTFGRKIGRALLAQYLWRVLDVGLRGAFGCLLVAHFRPDVSRGRYVR